MGRFAAPLLADTDLALGGGSSGLVVAVRSDAERRAALRRLVARHLGLLPAAVTIVHADGVAPRLVAPADIRLCLSSSSRGAVAALMAAPCRAGIDVEAVEPGREPPWHVLHRAEAEALRASTAGGRARAFARLWSCKEAYLKALGLGLAREPASVRVDALDETRASIGAPDGPACEARTTWHAHAGLLFCVSAVLLPHGLATGSSAPAPARDGERAGSGGIERPGRAGTGHPSVPAIHGGDERREEP